MREGNLDAAEAEAKLALDAPASKPIAYALLGSIRLQQQKYSEGTTFLERAIEANPDLVGARLNLAQAYTLLGEDGRAEDLFRDVLERAPTNPNAQLGLARIEAKKGNHRQALDFAKSVEDQLRASPDGLLLLTSCYTGVGNLAAARALVEDWSGLKGVPHAWTVKFALALSNGGLNPEAIQVLEGIKREGLSSFDVAFNLAGFCLLEDDLGKASENYELAATD